MGDPIGFGRNVSQMSTTTDSQNYYHTRVKRTLGATGITDTTKHKSSRHRGQSLAKGSCGVGVLLVYATIGLDDP